MNSLSNSSFFVGAPRFSFKPKSYDRIRIWRIEDGKQLQTLRGHKSSIHSMTFSPDSKFLVSIGGDGKIRFWRMPPRNYFWLWFLGVFSIATLIYWQGNNLISWLNLKAT
ncbi:WD40 repeat domain-containing protein [Myxosarcina sp. GI1(2024)]